MTNPLENYAHFAVQRQIQAALQGRKTSVYYAMKVRNQIISLSTYHLLKGLKNKGNYKIFKALFMGISRFFHPTQKSHGKADSTFRTLKNWSQNIPKSRLPSDFCVGWKMLANRVKRIYSVQRGCQKTVSLLFSFYCLWTSGWKLGKIIILKILKSYYDFFPVANLADAHRIAMDDCNTLLKHCRKVQQ